MSDHHDQPLLGPGELDLTTPSPARMYDAYLGGKDHYAVDREAVEKVKALWPSVPAWARANREFLIRAVRYLAQECGIRQFLDHGSGLPTQHNVHQVAQSYAPEARVVYVDNDPAVLTHSRALLAHTANATFIRQDLRNAKAILTDPKLTAMLDLTQPVAVLLVAVLHFVEDADGAYEAVQTLRKAMAPGSYLVVTHAAPGDPSRAEQLTTLYPRTTAASGVLRTPEEVQRFFTGLDLLDPGLVDVREWRPELGSNDVGEIPAGAAWMVAGVGRKP